MKKIHLALLLISTLCFSQTDKHVNVPGTRCSIIPPKNFIQASGFSGFQNNKNGASIMFSELPTSYSVMSNAFTSEALKSKGMILISKETINFNNGKATYFKIKQEVNGQHYLKQLLMFGNDNKTIMVNGIYPETAKIENEVKESVLSTSYNED
nr:hypothetical protein [uncultured Flavobacterium sp.]